jgi:thiol-disulfide isomerase/thioredoxin
MPKPLVAEKAAKAAPAVSFTDARGVRHSLKEYQGKYVLLNMWATWCAPCVAELPALARLKAAVPGMTVLAVDLTGKKETPAKADAFLKSHNAASLGTAVDTETVFMRSFTAAVMPTTVLIDPKGKVIARAEGPAEWASPAAIAYFQSLK